MDIIHNKSNTLPEQVEENRENIEKLAEATGYPEGINIQSTGEPNGKVLTSDGNGGANWENAPEPPSPEDIEGTSIKSTGITSAKVLTSNGIGGSKWGDIIKVVTLENTTGILNNDDYDAILHDNTVIRYPVQIGGYGYFRKTYNFSLSLFIYEYTVQISEEDDKYTFKKYSCRIQSTRNYTITETTINIPKINILNITTTTGTLTQAQYDTLIANEQNIIIFSSATQPEYKTIFRYENRVQDWDTGHYIRQYVNANNNFTESDGNIVLNKYIVSIDETTLQYTYTISNQNLSSIYQRRDLLEGTVVKSTNVPQGKVLTANGNGGATWEDVGGSEQYILRLTTTSGTLTNEQIENLKQPNSIIVDNNNRIYFRYSLTSTILNYRALNNGVTTISPNIAQYTDIFISIVLNNNSFSQSAYQYNISCPSINITGESGTITQSKLSYINQFESILIDDTGTRYYKYSSFNNIIYYYTIPDITYETTNNNIFAQYKIIEINQTSREYQVYNNTIDFSNTYQKKLTAEKGISIDSDNKIGHSNTPITADTEEKLKFLKADQYGHIISYNNADVSKTEVEYLKGCDKSLKAQTTTSSSAFTINGLHTSLTRTNVDGQSTTSRLTLQGNMVYASYFGIYSASSGISNSFICLGTVASGYRPKTRTAINFTTWNLTPTSACGYVDTDGKIYCWVISIGSGASNLQFNFNATWQVA